MIVGFDATTVRGNKTGVGYYTSRLLERLTRVGAGENPIEELLVLSNRPAPIPPGALPRTSLLSYGHFPVRAVWMQAVLPRILRDRRPDLCHFTNYIAPLSYEGPFVVTFHDMTLQLFPHLHTWRKRLLTKSLAPAIARKARLIITPSESAREDLAELFGVSRNKIRAIPHAADTGFRRDSSAASRERLESRYGVRKPYVLYVGTLEPRKNLPRALEAFSRLRHRFPEHGFYLAGDLGWGSRDTLRAIENFDKVDNVESGRAGRVKRLGYVREEDLPALYSHAELFVYPSLYEGFGFPVVEAMACGVPVLTSSTSSLREIAEGAALLVDPRDVSSIARGMKRALGEDELGHRLSADGLARARSFSWERTTLETLEVYEEALARSGVRPRTVEPRSGARCGLETETGSAAAAVVNTVAYGALFDSPMKLHEIERQLMGASLTTEELRTLLSTHPVVRRAVEHEPPFYFLRGRRESVSARLRARSLTRALLERHRRALDTVRRAPFVRMVALSGATAHDNSADGDIDLFVITRRGRAWAVALYLFAAMKLRGLRGTICLNYFRAEDRLRLDEHDPFTAHQIVSLRPLAGHSLYERFVRANAWGARFFPNFWNRPEPWEPREPSRAHRDRAGSRALEALLCPGGGFLLERIGRTLLGGYLRRRHRLAGRPTTVKLEPGVIKLHFHDHGRALSQRIERMLASIPSPPVEPPSLEGEGGSIDAREGATHVGGL